MKKNPVQLDFEAITRRIEKEMEGYSPGAWAKKVGVRINVISNIHGASARQNPSLNYILAVSLATGKPMEYFLWGDASYERAQARRTHVYENGLRHWAAVKNNFITSESPDP